MSSELWLGLGLMLVFEGIMPFALPQVWRSTLKRMSEMSDRQIRTIGFCSLIAGLLISLAVK
ncbi:DUF2065 domain-containing protein [Chitinibacter bivalviorum]|uniref:DUF2065 domain-containing protein n=1 Tax=Chitinibacter bivalviorum TaxID=2739434 RepID=A0A7H9BK98_9NEIS|nr:DUF2065 domain-containing protein [Chitinibacter bivalviorum]QLG87914.1 DUF2065 domain-containing protein [Chitinibacter bivalviorum]